MGASSESVIVTEAASSVEESRARWLPVSRPRMIEFLITTFAALTVTKPRMSIESMTVPAWVMVRSP